MKNLIASKKQFLLYCVIGFSGVALDFAVYSLLVRFGGLNYQAANALGYASGTLLSFVLNARFNFRVTDRIALRMLSFFGVAFLGWLMSAGLLHMLVENFGVGKYAAKLITLVAVVLLQYNLNRLFSFRKASTPK
ncbi:MAG TPA: GtrA family protein [Verrucomicrobiae bacterium]|nr:GtrA family protein [Verrucomicrobiae bacterium]